LTVWRPGRQPLQTTPPRKPLLFCLCCTSPYPLRFSTLNNSACSRYRSHRFPVTLFLHPAIDTRRPFHLLFCGQRETTGTIDGAWFCSRISPPNLDFTHLWSLLFFFFFFFWISPDKFLIARIDDTDAHGRHIPFMIPGRRQHGFSSHNAPSRPTSTRPT
jgi:hypothetical protein